MFAVHAVKSCSAFRPAPEQMPPLNALIVTAGCIEWFCGLLVAVGFFAGYAAFLASGLMACLPISAGPFPATISIRSYQFLPSVNRGELAVMYCSVFLSIAAQGSGVWSVDRCPENRRYRATLRVRTLDEFNLDSPVPRAAPRE